MYFFLVFFVRKAPDDGQMILRGLRVMQIPTIPSNNKGKRTERREFRLEKKRGCEH